MRKRKSIKCNQNQAKKTTTRPAASVTPTPNTIIEEALIEQRLRHAALKEKAAKETNAEKGEVKSTSKIENSPMGNHVSLIYSFQNRILGYSDPGKIVHDILVKKYTLTQLMQSSLHTPDTVDITSHPNFGIAYTHSNSIRLIGPYSNSNPIYFEPDTCRVRLEWSPNETVPVLAVSLSSSHSTGVACFKLNAGSHTHPTLLTHYNSKFSRDGGIFSTEWSHDSSQLLLGSGTGLILLSCADISRVRRINLCCPAVTTSFSRSSPSVVVTGSRNGDIITSDLRSHESSRRAIGKLPLCPDHLEWLDNYIVATDIIGSIKVLDIRSERVALDVYISPKSTLVRHRRFWTCPDSRSLVASYCGADGVEGLGVWSTSGNWPFLRRLSIPPASPASPSPSWTKLSRRSPCLNSKSSCYGTLLHREQTRLRDLDTRTGSCEIDRDWTGLFGVSCFPSPQPSSCSVFGLELTRC